MKRTTEYTAEDGTKFETAAECKAHEEREALVRLLSGRSIVQVENAFDRIDDIIDLAAAFERAGTIIAAKRRADGDLKRARKPKTPLAESASKLNAAMRAQGESK